MTGGVGWLGLYWAYKGACFIVFHKVRNLYTFLNMFLFIAKRLKQKNGWNIVPIICDIFFLLPQDNNGQVLFIFLLFLLPLFPSLCLSLSLCCFAPVYRQHNIWNNLHLFDCKKWTFYPLFIVAFLVFPLRNSPLDIFVSI